MKEAYLKTNLIHHTLPVTSNSKVTEALVHNVVPKQTLNFHSIGCPSDTTGLAKYNI
jgi:hypothetical protein